MKKQEAGSRKLEAGRSGFYSSFQLPASNFFKEIVFMLFICFPFVSFAQATEAQVYHDKLIAEARSVKTALSNFNSSLETDSAYLMHSTRAQLKKQLDSSLTHLDKIGAFKNDDDWNRALTLQFQFYRVCVDKEYIKFIDYSLRLSVLTEDEITDFTKIISKLGEKELGMSELLDMAYKEFVNKYKVVPAK